MDTCNENNDAKVKFMRCNRLCLSWYEHDNQCWVQFQHIICAVAATHLWERSDQ